jgi:hypothetical protein
LVGTRNLHAGISIALVAALGLGAALAASPPGPTLNGDFTVGAPLAPVPTGGVMTGPVTNRATGPAGAGARAAP